MRAMMGGMQMARIVKTYVVVEMTGMCSSNCSE